MTPEKQINDYLSQLRVALKGITVSEREDIVEEIHMHIRERVADPQCSLDAVFAGLGPAHELAQQYRTGVLVQRARTSLSPVVILRAALRWATMGVEGFLVFMIAIIGYALGGGFVALAILKPIFPANTGFFVGPGQFSFSFLPDSILASFHPPLHEVLGWWLIPVCLVLGSLSLALTTKLLQFLMGRFRWKVPLGAATRVRAAMMAF